jgi:hypothetical protein
MPTCFCYNAKMKDNLTQIQKLTLTAKGVLDKYQKEYPDVKNG